MIHVPGRRAATLMAIGALAVVGCGGSADPEPVEEDSADQEQPAETDSDTNDADSDAGALSVDACSLLTTDQVSSATGANAEAGEINADLSSEDQSICEWVTDASAVAFVQVVVSESDAQAERDVTEEVFGPAQDADVAGTTDAYVIAGLAGAQDGPYYVQVTVVPDDDDAALELLGLATSALE